MSGGGNGGEGGAGGSTSSAPLCAWYAMGLYHECTWAEGLDGTETHPEGLTACDADDVEGDAAPDDYLGCCDGDTVYYENGGGFIATWDCNEQ